MDQYLLLGKVIMISSRTRKPKSVSGFGGPYIGPTVTHPLAAFHCRGKWMHVKIIEHPPPLIFCHFDLIRLLQVPSIR